MGSSDRELVDKSLGGDRDAFAQLVARYQTLVCSIALSITGDFARSEDVGQEAFLTAWCRLNELQDREKVKSWLSGITRNLAHNAMRDDKKLQFGDPPELAAVGPRSPIEEVLHKEESALATAAIARLPESYREPLVLFYRQSQSIAEVANALELTTDVVKQRLSRGRKMLKEEVMLAIERSLSRTKPTHAFTLAVIAAIPTLASQTAVAATTGSAVGLAKSAGSAAALKTSGLLGSVFGTAAGLGGAAFGTWASWSTARYQAQRDLIRRQSFVYIAGLLVFAIPFAAMALGWRPILTFGARGYVVVYGAWMILFMIANVVWIVRTIQRFKETTEQAQSTGAAELPATSVRRWLSQWEGRRWRSRTMLLGRPLIDIAFSDPGEAYFSPAAKQVAQASGWIAVGDRARGMAVAIGNTAVAPIAIGTLSCGIVSLGVVAIGAISFGVVSVALLALGVVSVGGWSVGGAVATGYLAAAPVAIAWEAAQGAVAIAFQYADGVEATAQHVGDDAAASYFADSSFFGTAHVALERLAAHSLHLQWSIVLLLPLFLGALRLAYRPKDRARINHSEQSHGRFS